MSIALGAPQKSTLGALVKSALGERGFSAQEASGDVFLGGVFTSLGGVSCTNGICWDNAGAQFRAASITGSTRITDYCIFRGVLYAAWRSGSSGGVKAWNPVTLVFDDVAGTNALTGIILGLAADANYLVAVGELLHLDGSGNYALCKYDGETWSEATNPAGSSVNYRAERIVLANDGEFVIITTPTGAGAQGTLHKGDLTTWSTSTQQFDTVHGGAGSTERSTALKNITGTIFVGSHNNSADIQIGGVDYNSVFTWSPDTYGHVGAYDAGVVMNILDVERLGSTYLGASGDGTGGDLLQYDGDWDSLVVPADLSTSDCHFAKRLNDGTVLTDVQHTEFRGVVGQNLYQIDTSLNVSLFHSATCNGQIYAGIDIGETTLAAQFKFTAVSASVGWDEGGESRSITGSGFTASTTVTWDGSPLAATYVSSTTLTVTTPAHAAGAINVTLTENGIDRTNASAFTYRHLTISSVSPTSGSTAGGTSVTVNGTWLNSDVDVYFDGVIATNIVYNSKAGTITCDTPAHGAGVVDVVITEGVASDTLAASYTYT